MHTLLVLLPALLGVDAERAGLVRFERQGRRRVYRVEHARLGLVTEWLSWFDRDAAVPAVVRRAWGR